MNYVMSDIHGHYSWFKAMLERINFSNNDHLYILGDVLDKGEDSASLIVDILNDSRITLLLGNHEKMFLDSFESSYEEWVWLMENGGFQTMQQFGHKGINIKSLKHSLEKLPVQLFIEINGKKFCLVHAKPVLPRVTNEMLYNKESEMFPISYHMENLSQMEIETALWSRALSFESTTTIPMIEEYIGKEATLIIGHTPVLYCEYANNHKFNNQIAHLYNGRVINIDCGCAGDYNLGCLRLEDMKEFYIPEQVYEEVPIP